MILSAPFSLFNGYFALRSPIMLPGRGRGQIARRRSLGRAAAWRRFLQASPCHCEGAKRPKQSLRRRGTATPGDCFAHSHSLAMTQLPSGLPVIARARKARSNPLHRRRTANLGDCFARSRSLAMTRVSYSLRAATGTLWPPAAHILNSPESLRHRGLSAQRHDNWGQGPQVREQVLASSCGQYAQRLRPERVRFRSLLLRPPRPGGCQRGQDSRPGDLPADGAGGLEGLV